MNIQNITERQFDKTMQRENVSVIDYFNGTKYDVFFRRNNRSVSPEGKVRLYYKQTSKIDYGTTFTLNGKQYIVINQDADESGYFYSAIAKQCNEIVTLAGHEIPVVLDKDTFDIQNGSVLNYIRGDVTIYAQLNDITSAVAVNDVLQAFGNYYKVGNRFIDGRIVYFNLEQTVKPQDNYKIIYNGVSSFDMKDSTTYQLSYTVTNNNSIIVNPTITYQSSANDVATVDENGLMTMLKEGSVDITATAYGASCTTTMTIANTSAPTYTLSLTSSSDTIKVNGTYKTMTCRFADKDGQDITDSLVTELSAEDFRWTCAVGSTDLTNNSAVVWANGSAVNTKKIKLTDGAYDYLGQTLTVKVTVNGVTASKDLEITE